MAHGLRSDGCRANGRRCDTKVEGIMKHVIAMMGLILAIGAAPAGAQQPNPGTDPHHPATPPAASTGSPAAGKMPMDMCRQMMTGTPQMMMGGSMMGGDEHKMDPRIMAQMLQMRGEMMKAMGDIMLKHGQKLQDATR
jgi:hypothetical protein